MKKIICFILMLMFCLSVVGCNTDEISYPSNAKSVPTQEPFDISIPENLTFGMKESEIISLYGEPDLEYGDIISYELKKAYGSYQKKYDLDFDKIDMVFGITEKGLQMVQYAFGFTYSRENCPYLTNSEQIKNKVAEKYGEPSDTTEKWNDKKYKEDPASWNKAIDLGHLVLTHTWETELFTITLRTDGTGVFLDYTAK